MSDVPTWPGGRSYRPCFTRYDWSRSYVLFDDVESNIPRRGCVGQPGGFNYARGLLVELSIALDATPAALRYRELETGRHGDTFGIRLTATVYCGPRRLDVVSRHESAPYGPRGDYWCLTVAGEVPDDGEAKYPPSLPWMAHMVRRHLDWPATS